MNKNRVSRAALAILFSCFLMNANAQESGWKIPSWADTLINPFTSGNAVIAQGKELYTSYCMACHGKEGNGKGAPGITFAVQPASFHNINVIRQKDGTLFWKITKGFGGMPGFKGTLTEDQRWKLVTYLRTFAKDKTGGAQPAFENELPAGGFEIDPSLSSDYFPVPTKVKNVVGSQTMQFMVDTVVAKLTLPWSMAFLPDKKTVLIAERSGNLRIIRSGKKAGMVGGNVPVGLREVEVHPKFEQNHFIYLSYYIDPVKNKDTTKSTGGYAVIMRGTLTGDSLTETKTIYKAGPFKEDGFWYGNKLAFDNNGYLYVTIGQRTIKGMHKWNTAQDKSVISGKIIRLNDDGSIPKDNPFANAEGALAEIYTLGHRQPEGLVFDRHTGKLWESEHGENGGCELNLIEKGKNYGWPKVTYSTNYDGTIITEDTLMDGMQPPVKYWRPALAPSGMDFVYGNHYSGWNGSVVIGSLVQKRLNRTTMVGDRAMADEKLIQGIGRVRDVVFGPDEFLYLLTEDTGLLIRILPVKKNNMKTAFKAGK